MLSFNTLECVYFEIKLSQFYSFVFTGLHFSLGFHSLRIQAIHALKNLPLMQMMLFSFTAIKIPVIGILAWCVHTYLIVAGLQDFFRNLMWKARSVCSPRFCVAQAKHSYTGVHSNHVPHICFFFPPNVSFLSCLQTCLLRCLVYFLAVFSLRSCACILLEVLSG